LSLIALLEAIRREFYEWCGALSIDEACGNPELIAHVEAMETALRRRLDSTFMTRGVA
jgi:hypothetical protein